MANRLDIPRLETDRLILEPLAMTHSCGMFALWSDPAVCEFSGVVRDHERNVIPMPARTRDDSDRIIDFWLRAASAGWGFRWAIVRSDPPDTFAGIVGFNALAPCFEIAYHLLPSQWGQGIMLEACETAIRWAKSNGASGIEAFVEPENRASIALASRLGMVPTGVFAEGAERLLVEVSSGPE